MNYEGNCRMIAAMEMYQAGTSIRNIAIEFNVDVMTIYRWKKQLKVPNNNASRHYTKGHNTVAKLTSEQIEKLRREIKARPMSAIEVNSFIRDEFEVEFAKDYLYLFMVRNGMPLKKYGRRASERKKKAKTPVF